MRDRSGVLARAEQLEARAQEIKAQMRVLRDELAHVKQEQARVLGIEVVPKRQRSGFRPEQAQLTQPRRHSGHTDQETHSPGRQAA
jgi:hypothetical protein